MGIEADKLDNNINPYFTFTYFLCVTIYFFKLFCVISISKSDEDFFPKNGVRLKRGIYLKIRKMQSQFVCACYVPERFFTLTFAVKLLNFKVIRLLNLITLKKIHTSIYNLFSLFIILLSSKKY